MQKTKKLFLIFISIFLVSQNIDAADSVDTVAPQKPKFIYRIDNLTYFDNRMFYLPYHPSKMFLGDRLTALAGIGLKKEHKLYAGLTAMIPFGSDYKSYKFQPMVYYRFEQALNDKQNLKLHFGILPCREMETSLPGFMRRGSAEYTIPNLQGTLAQYQLKINDKNTLSLEYAFDWRKVKSKTDRDNYGMILAGKLANNGMLNVGFIAQWDRLGYNLDTIKNNCDNVVYNVYAKVDFAKFTKNFKSIFLQAGYVGSFSNDSAFVNKSWCNAIMIDCGIQWKMISLTNSLYMSINKGNLMPLFEYSKDVYVSDQFYKASLYNKTALSFDVFNKSVFSLKAQFLMHVVPEYKIGWQQKITAQVKF